MSAILSIENLSFSYPGRSVLESVSLEIAAGERFGLLGPNGSGKSTLVRLLSRVLRPTGGHIRLGGRDLADFSARELARSVAVVPQATALEFSFSVIEVVLMGRSPHLGGLGFESDRDVAAAERAIRDVGIADLAGRWFHELSGGEKQRVVIARALAQEPDVLLLDEPTTFLDIAHAVEILDLLTELSLVRGMTLVNVLHDLNLAALYCERLAFLKAGRLLAEGATADVLTYHMVKQAYETEVYVARNELTGRLNVLPLARKHREELRERFEKR